MNTRRLGSYYEKSYMQAVIESFRNRRCHVWIRALGELTTELIGLMEMWKNR